MHSVMSLKKKCSICQGGIQLSSQGIFDEQRESSESLWAELRLIRGSCGMSVYVCVFLCVYLINLLWRGERKGRSDVGARFTAVNHEDTSRDQQHLERMQT